jgi:hypothetical protein
MCNRVRNTSDLQSLVCIKSIKLCKKFDCTHLFQDAVQMYHLSLPRSRDCSLPKTAPSPKCKIEEGLNSFPRDLINGTNSPRNSNSLGDNNMAQAECTSIHGEAVLGASNAAPWRFEDFWGVGFESHLEC